MKVNCPTSVRCFVLSRKQYRCRLQQCAPKLNILEAVAVCTPRPDQLWCDATWRVCSRRAFVALACNFCFILFLILSLWRKCFARHSPTVIPPILPYFCNLRSSGIPLSFLDNLEISRIQVIGGKYSFLWCCSLVAT